MAEEGQEHPNRGRQFLWFVGLWVAGIVAVAGFAYGVRAVLGL